MVTGNIELKIICVWEQVMMKRCAIHAMNYLCFKEGLRRGGNDQRTLLVLRQMGGAPAAGSNFQGPGLQAPREAANTLETADMVTS